MPRKAVTSAPACVPDNTASPVTNTSAFHFAYSAHPQTRLYWTAKWSQGVQSQFRRPGGWGATAVFARFIILRVRTDDNKESYSTPYADTARRPGGLRLGCHDLSLRRIGHGSLSWAVDDNMGSMTGRRDLPGL